MSEMQEKTSFHNQDGVLRLAMLANITSWVVLVFYLINFAGDLNTLVSNWPLQLPPDLFSQLTTWLGFISTPVFGIFYFLLLQGVSQLLYIGLDIYLDMMGESDEE